LIGLIVMGVLTFGIGVIPSNMFMGALIINTAFGLVIPIVNGSIGATLQSSIKPDMQGRVFAFIQSIAMLVSPLALIVAGPFADRFGIQPWFVIAGCVCTAMGALGFFFPEVMRIETTTREESLNVAAEPS
jgi:DHA3 family macrolide efflux protein-like MFS transporter